MEREIFADVCVVGGAGSGLAAALGAIEAGAKKVVLLEKQKNLGGTTLYCNSIFAAESPAQKRQGIQVTIDECFEQFMNVNNWQVDAKLVRNFYKASGELIEWMENLMGVEFYCGAGQTIQGVEKVYPTWHTIRIKRKRAGTLIVNAMANRCRELGVDILMETRAEHLITSASGRVIGVTADCQGEKIRVNATGGVILATGSFSANAELAERLCPVTSKYHFTKIMGALPCSTGDGILMGEEVGAITGTIGHLWIGPHNHGPGCSELSNHLMRRPHLIKVNRLGQRFANEAVWGHPQLFGWMFSVALLQQPEQICYAIMDQALYDDMVQKNEFINDQEVTHGRQVLNDTRYGEKKWLQGFELDIPGEVAAGRMAVCSTLEEAAEFIGCRPEALAETLDNYNGFCTAKYDDDFLKNPAYLVPLKTPPYYVLKGYNGLDNYYGGLLVDRDLHCVDKDHNPIPGLYAAGIGTSGWISNTYGKFGSAFGFALYSGHTAGGNAAKAAQNKEAEDRPSKKRKAKILDHCICCGACVSFCPVNAISEAPDEHMVIDLDKCVGCGICVNSCATMGIGWQP